MTALYRQSIAPTKICTKHLLNKEWISKIHEELNNKKINPTKYGKNIQRNTLQSKISRWSISTHKKVFYITLIIKEMKIKTMKPINHSLEMNKIKMLDNTNPV